MASEMAPMSWEDYFRQDTVAEIRRAATSLEREIDAEKYALRDAIGSKYTDILAVSQRIEAIKLLVYRQETDLTDFASRPPTALPDAAPELVKSRLEDEHVVVLATARILSTVDRSLVRRNFTLAARALYYAESLGLDAGTLAASKAKLDRKLDSWLVRGSHISHDMMQACIISRRWSPATFVAEFLAARGAQIKQVLGSGDEILGAFRIVDSTLLIHDQLVSDLCKSLLSQRRVSEMSEFSSQAPLVKLLQLRPQAVSTRAFPPECYAISAGDEEIADVVGFLDTVANEVEVAAERIFSRMANAGALTSALAKIVRLAQNVLSADKGMGKLLDACGPPFVAKFQELASQGSALNRGTDAESIKSWKERVTDLMVEQAAIGRMSRTIADLAPNLSARLAALESSTKTLLDTGLANVYAEERAALLKQPAEDLQAAISVVGAVAMLDIAYATLGGSAAEPPREQYERLAEFIVDQWSVAPRRAYLGGGDSGPLFELLRVMDETLTETMWSPIIIDMLRPLVLEKVKATQPSKPQNDTALSEEPPAAEPENDKAHSRRNRLLLGPLVG